MLEIAIGSLGLLPAQFWSLTLQEFNMILKGHNERKKQEREWDLFKLSQLAAWLNQVHTKRRLSPTDFYDPNKRQPVKKKTTPKETKKVLADLKAEFFK